MTTHRVVQGECISVIAARHGLTWRQVWEDPGNAELRARRKDPNVLYPGDEVTIPAKSPARVPVALDAKTTVVRRRVGQRPLRLTVLDEYGAPLADKDYTLQLEGGEQRGGRTDAQGVVFEELPVDVGSVSLDVGELHFDLLLGHLNPLEQTDDDGVSGAKARLRNLGYGVEAIDGTLDDSAQRALRAFQVAEGLDATGKLDDSTRERLRARHGC